jgi:hypothetical protein
MKVDEQIDRQFVQVTLPLRRAVQRFAQARIAEIVEQQQPLIQIARQYARRGQPGLAQPLGHGDEGTRILMRRRRVHQHGTIEGPITRK